ncbi:MAG: BMP family ABC transporter substrate-binding protein [Caldilinea sp.]|nr:BMP family ABC transporter substrate-binding protein [Caldilineaceae bacterium]MCB9119452.1 BMP family ABC transporter substrate-binding protein [Caldilineaceae bacterium]MCB9125525.1 BMP family ABC transporter substrate-binding protein [Caldilineaceae bacterium]MCO5211599.1 BMP family ABC transporter substrate-binding protein [Caldilinea sp.]HRW46657.1 BMP family ABC transporter substrate-binding protein [Caldilinea sp.]
MFGKRIWIVLSVLLLAALVFGGCVASQPAAAPAAPAEQGGGEAAAAPESGGGVQIPDIEDGKYNVAFVYVGPHDDGGWSQAHDVGREYVEANLENVHTAYIENVAEGADAEQVIRSLARKGFDVIFTTSFGFMDASAMVAEEFPDVDIVHISGFQSNGANFGNLMGAMEDMKYLAGMLAGSRAKTDGNPRLGYIATFPIPEELRLGNAFALGAQQTCPDCKIDVRWIFTWHDPIIEKEAAASLFDSGAQIVMTGADTPAPAEAAPEGKWGITYDYSGNCKVDACLTSMYWNWGPVYADIVERSRNGEYVGGSEYFDADSGALGLFGFMEGETPQPGVEGLPEEDLQLIRDTLAQMLAGEFTRFDVFKGPITDNQGNEVLAEGVSLEQADLDGFAQFGSPCTTCMYWWNENITAELPSLE